MRDLKKTLKWAGIMALIANVLNISSLFFNIYFDFYLFGIVEESICIALTFVTGLTYLILLKKNNEFYVKHKGIFLAISLINLFNNIIVWGISLWVQIAVSNYARYNYMKTMFKQGNQQNDGSIILEKDDYTIKQETEDFSESLKKLENLKNKGEITEEEYNELRQAVIKKFLEQQK